MLPRQRFVSRAWGERDHLCKNPLKNIYSIRMQSLQPLLTLSPDDSQADSKAEAFWHEQPALAQAMLRAAATPALGSRRKLEAADLLPMLGLCAVKALARGLDLARRGLGFDGLIAGLAAQLIAQRVPVPRPDTTLFAAWLFDHPLPPETSAEQIFPDTELRSEILQHRELSLTPPLDGDRISLIAQCIALGQWMSRNALDTEGGRTQLVNRAARLGLEPAAVRSMLPDLLKHLAEWSGVVGHALQLPWDVTAAAQPLAADTEALATELARVYHYLVQNATTDAQTGLANRRYALARLETEWAAARRRGGVLSFVGIETDTAGAAVQIGRLLKETARMQDVVCRMSDERFGVICVDTGVVEAGMAAARLCRAVGDAQLRVASQSVTVSLGVAALDSTISSVDEFMRRAYDASHAARAQGGNRYVVWAEAAA